MKFAALIPCYNVGAACVPVIRGSLAHVHHCVVVDDGSTDDTSAQAASVSKDRCTVIRHDCNVGKGAALLTGFRHLMKQPETEAIIVLDGDGQHDPSLIPLFVACYQNESASLVYGNRMADPGRMPLHRRALNSISNRLVSRVCGRRVYDSQCGYRLYSMLLLRETVDLLTTRRYELETEILIAASRRGFSIAPVPVPSIYSARTTSLSHHNLADVLRIARLLLRR